MNVITGLQANCQLHPEPEQALLRPGWLCVIGQLGSFRVDRYVGAYLESSEMYNLASLAFLVGSVTYYVNNNWHLLPAQRIDLEIKYY